MQNTWNNWIISFSGYGNIAPKTNWGRIVTMIYAGMVMNNIFEKVEMNIPGHTLSGDKVSPKKGYKLFMGTSI